MNISEHIFKSERHQTFYLAAGPEDGELIYLVHGWPDLSIGWIKQIEFLSQLGLSLIHI